MPRLTYFDVIKGIAIFMVVMGHVLTMCVRDIDAAVLFKMIKNIHMPLFFFISGFFTYKVTAEGRPFALPRLGQRAQQLLIPFIVVSALWIWYFPHSGLQSPIESTFHGLYSDVWKNGYWFTLVLFEIFLIYWVTAKAYGAYRADKPHKALSGEIVIAVVIWVALCAIQLLVPGEATRWASWEFVAAYYPVFMLGIFARKYRDWFLPWVQRGTTMTVAIICGAVLIYLLMYPWEFPFMAWWGIPLVIPPLLHAALVPIAFGTVIPWTQTGASPQQEGSRPAPTWCQRYWILLGKESLAIYLLHYFFLFPLTSLQEPLRALSLGFTPTFVVASVVAFIVIALVLGVNYIIQKSPQLALLLTGKPLKRL
ncbi:MAG: acyltransferase family protein [Bacteroidales bacterium]|nr:acyltransferase family protein [Bacteroidales bacterium]MCD8394032.1 acyltransferase family protein [Bacteroidales bacterium]